MRALRDVCPVDSCRCRTAASTPVSRTGNTGSIPVTDALPTQSVLAHDRGSYPPIGRFDSVDCDASAVPRVRRWLVALTALRSVRLARTNVGFDSLHRDFSGCSSALFQPPAASDARGPHPRGHRCNPGRPDARQLDVAQQQSTWATATRSLVQPQPSRRRHRSTDGTRSCEGRWLRFESSRWHLAGRRHCVIP